MYIISGTLFIITSLFLFVINEVLYFDQSNPLIFSLAFLSLFAGITFYFFTYRNNKQDNEP